MSDSLTTTAEQVAQRCTEQEHRVHEETIAFCPSCFASVLHAQVEGDAIFVEQLTKDEIRLHMGELTRDEMRLVFAALGWVATAIRQQGEG